MFAGQVWIVVLAMAMLFALARTGADALCTIPPIQPVSIGVNIIDLATKVSGVPVSNPFGCGDVDSGSPMIVARFIAPKAGTYFFHVAVNGPNEEQNDGVISILNGTNACNTPEKECTDDPSSALLTLRKGETTLIRAALYDGEAFVPGTVCAIVVTDRPMCKPVANLVLNRTFLAPVTPGSSQYTPGFCNTSSERPDYTQVMTFKAPVAATYFFETSITGDDNSVLEVRRGSCSGTVIECDDDSGSGESSLVEAYLSEGEVVYVLLSPYYSGFTNSFIPVRVYSFEVDLPAEVEATCMPSLGATQAQCNNRNAAWCSRWGVPLKWTNGCGRRARRGCQCPQTCGYTCRGGCIKDPLCAWQNNKCFSRATLEQGAAVEKCVVNALDFPITASPP